MPSSGSAVEPTRCHARFYVKFSANYHYAHHFVCWSDESAAQQVFIVCWVNAVIENERHVLFRTGMDPCLRGQESTAGEVHSTLLSRHGSRLQDDKILGQRFLSSGTR